MKWIQSFPTTSALTAYLDGAESGYYLLRDESDTGTTRIHYEHVNNLANFCIKAVSASTVTFSRTDRNLEYSLDDGTTWTAYTSTVSLAQGAKMYWRRNSTSKITYQSIGTFTLTGNIEAQGNINSLLSSDFDTLTDLSGWGVSYGIFEGLFGGQTALTKVDKLLLPATVLGNYYTYAHLFNGCSNLTGTAPVLPATYFKYNSYDRMFGGTQINKIVIYVETIQDMNTFKRLFYNLCSTGDLYNLGGVDLTDAGVPSGWTIHTRLDD